MTETKKSFDGGQSINIFYNDDYETDFVSEKGIANPPFETSIKKLFEANQ